MALKNQILTIIKPAIPLKELSIFNTDEIDPLDEKQLLVEDSIDSTGATVPFIVINGHTIETTYIVSVSLYQDSFLPQLKITFTDKMSLFSSYTNPIFEPLVSIYVKSQVPTVKPFRGDYLITNLSSVSLGENDNLITLDCELYIPGIYNNVSVAYPNMTSTDCLKKIATDLKLGFATNEDSTDDKMTWLNPNLNYITFIKDEVVKRSYKSDTSFFTCFIDRYYILNFINVERQMEQDREFDLNHIAADIVTSAGSIKGGDSRLVNPIISETVLTNNQIMKNNANFIREYWPISNNGEILKNQSFRNRIMWYETSDHKVNSFFIEPLSNKKTLKNTTHQIPSIESLKNMEIKKWLGFDYGNAHKHNKFAKMLNYHNNKELDKNQIGVKVFGFNSTILRGSRVPVVLYDETYINSIKKTLEGKINSITDAKSEFHMDEILSDVYYVKDIIYRYEALSEESQMFTEIILAKRNWKKINFNNVNI